MARYAECPAGQLANNNAVPALVTAPRTQDQARSISYMTQITVRYIEYSSAALTFHIEGLTLDF
ncbi:hypothetical protein [Marinagarivorans algicola]|uniref:hypothetical protein n=1 Tax=Marinagarivorans algicola TaxID=1513270 RepID=UPI0006B6077B|nr:hypothetical protein [Marinagarivorans algicola]